MSIYFITGNQKKLEEVKKILGIEGLKRLDIDLPEIQALRSEDVVKEKAEKAYEKARKPVIVEDVSLYIKAWHDFPGALIKWQLDTMGVDGICRCMKDYDNRKAVLECCVGYYDGKKFRIFKGDVEGTITQEPKGSREFGFDPIFIPKGYEKTYAEMDKDLKNSISHRYLAFSKLKKYLNK